MIETDEPLIETDEVVTVQLPAQARYIRVARLVGAGLANDLGIDLEGLDDVRLAIGEVCALATQVGAEFIELRFALDDRGLRVFGGGRANTSGSSVETSVDDDHIRLVQQILDVACADHELTRDEAGLSFSLTFTHGS